MLEYLLKNVVHYFLLFVFYYSTYPPVFDGIRIKYFVINLLRIVSLENITLYYAILAKIVRCQIVNFSTKLSNDKLKKLRNKLKFFKFFLHEKPSKMSDIHQ